MRSLGAALACAALLVVSGACSGDDSSGPPNEIGSTAPAGNNPASVGRGQTGETNPGPPTQTSNGVTSPGGGGGTGGTSGTTTGTAASGGIGDG